MLDVASVRCDKILRDHFVFSQTVLWNSRGGIWWTDKLMYFSWTDKSCMRRTASSTIQVRSNRTHSKVGRSHGTASPTQYMPVTLHLLSCTFLHISPTFVVPLILSILILPFLVTPLIPFNILSGCAKRCKHALHSTNISFGTNEV